MLRRYTLTTEEFKAELKRANETQYKALLASAKHVNDSTVILIIETEGK